MPFDYRPSNEYDWIHKIIKNVLCIFSSGKMTYHPPTRAPALVLQACNKAIEWLDAAVMQINRMQFQDPATRNLLIAQLGLLRMQLEGQDKNALGRTAAISVAISLLPDLTQKTSNLAKLNLKQVRGSPDNVRFVQSYVSPAIEAAKKAEIAIASFVAGKTKEPVNLEEHFKSFDASAGTALRLLGISLAFQDSARKIKARGIEGFDELASALEKHYNTKREQNEKLEYVKEQRDAFERAFNRLDKYLLAELVEIDENGAVSVKNDSLPMQLLNRQSVLRAYQAAWQELAQKWVGDGRISDPQKLRFLIDVARAGVLAQIKALRDTTVRVTDENGSPVIGRDNKPATRDLLPREVAQKLLSEQLYRVLRILEEAGNSLKSGLEPAVAAGVFESVYAPGIRGHLREAAFASYDAASRINDVIGKYLLDYIRGEEDKAATTGLRRIGYWLKSRGERYGEYVADVAVLGLGAIALVASGGSLSPAVLAAESAYWGMRGAQAVYNSYLATGGLRISSLTTGIAMAIPGAGGLGLRVVKRTAMRTTIEIGTAAASAYLLGGGVYGIAEAIRESGRYGLTGSDIESIAAGTVMLGIGMRGRWLARKSVPSRPVPVEKPGKLVEEAILQVAKPAKTGAAERPGKMPLPQKRRTTEPFEVVERTAAEQVVTQDDLAFARQYLESEGVSATLASRIVSMLSAQPSLLLDKKYFLDGIVATLQRLPAGLIEQILSQPPHIRLYLLRNERALRGIEPALAKISFLAEAIAKDQMLRGMRELDYLADPRVLEREITDFTRIILRARKAREARTARLRGEMLRINRATERKLRDPASKEIAAIFNKEIGGLLAKFAEHGTAPLAAFSYPGVNYKFKNVFGLDLTAGDRAIFFVSGGRIYVIHIGDHASADRLLDRLRPSKKSLEETYPQATFEAA